MVTDSFSADSERSKTRVKDDSQLTGPEYELLRILLIDIRKFKKKNENSDRPIPAFVYRICDDDLDRLIDKMHDRMHKFWPAYFETCW